MRTSFAMSDSSKSEDSKSPLASKEDTLAAMTAQLKKLGVEDLLRYQAFLDGFTVDKEVDDEHDKEVDSDEAHAMYNEYK